MTASEKHAAEVDRLDMLNHRIHLMEKQCEDEPTSFGGVLCQCVYDICRSVPWCSILAMVPVVTGLGMVMSSHSAVLAGAKGLQMSPQTIELLEDVFVICVFALVVDILVLCSAFPASGLMREYVFGHDHRGIMLCVACMVGPCILGLLMFLLLVLFLGFFVGIILSVPGATMLNVLKYSCVAAAEYGDKGSPSGIAAAYAIMIGADAQLMDERVKMVCTKDYKSLAYAGNLFAAGVVTAALGKAWLLIAHMNNWEKVMMQKDYDADEDAEKEVLTKYWEANGR